PVRGHAGPGLRRPPAAQAGGPRRHHRRHGAVQALRLDDRDHLGRAARPGHPGAGHGRAHHHRGWRRVGRRRGVPDLAAAGREGEGHLRRRRGRPGRAHRLAVRQGRRGQGGSADQRRARRAAAPRRGRARRDPGRHGGGHRGGRRRRAAARRTRAGRPRRQRRLRDRRRDRAPGAARAGVPHREQRRLLRSGGHRPHRRDGRRRGLRRARGPLRRHDRDGHPRPAAGVPVGAAERRVGRRAPAHDQHADRRGADALGRQPCADDGVRRAGRRTAPAVAGREHPAVARSRSVRRM
ncbi:MAG: Heat shock protein 60 family chaperone GroEL, partial [uncultured Frankineae bacterium]